VVAQSEIRWRVGGGAADELSHRPAGEMEEVVGGHRVGGGVATARGVEEALGAVEVFDAAAGHRIRRLAQEAPAVVGEGGGG
jgi:hypothetical protein